MKTFTIGIPSYNRPKQLERLLNSIQLNSKVNFEVLIIDDCSPKQKEISKCVSDAKHLKQVIKYIPLKKNIGYDENLLQLINNATGDYLIFVLDDDVINSQYLEKTIFFISKSKAKLGITAYQFADSRNIARVLGNSNFSKLISKKDYVNCIYNCVFTSGIIVSPQYIKSLNISKMKGMIYSQVLWSVLTASSQGVAYIKYPLVTIFADGPYGWGTNSAEPKNKFLADRKNLLSPIYYHKAFFKTIDKLQRKIEFKFFSRFLFEYSIRSYQLFERANRINGRIGVIEFLKAFLKEEFPLGVYYIFIFINFLVILLLGNILEIYSKKFFSKTPSQIYRLIRGTD